MPSRSRRWALTLGALLVVFVVTRLVASWVADHPDRYRSAAFTVTGDVDVYERWANEVGRQDRSAYGEVRIEYPPGSLPFILAPLAGADDDAYRSRFITLMVLVDAAGLAGLLVIARRVGSWWGPWAWTLLVPLLGPIAYLRLDLVPAVATIWALERAQAGGWSGVGGCLGFGAVAKVYPGLLLPLVVASRWRWRTVGAAAAVGLIGVLPFAGSLGGLWDSVAGYHSERGIHVESTWGAVLLAAADGDGRVRVEYDHGAFHVAGPGASALEKLSVALSLGALAGGVAVAWRRVDAGATVELAAVMLGTLALLLSTGTVFSPQFMLWLFALGAVAAGLAPRVMWAPAGLLAVAAVLSQVLYPFHYDGLLADDPGPLALLAVRNALVAVTGALVLVKVWRRRSRVYEHEEELVAA